MDISGANDRLQATRKALTGNFVVAIVIAYLLLVAIFSHWGYPLLIMTSVPIGISGGIVGLWLLNFIGSGLERFGLQIVLGSEQRDVDIEGLRIDVDEDRSGAGQ